MKKNPFSSAVALALTGISLHYGPSTNAQAQEPAPPARDNATLQARRMAAAQAQERLRNAWREFGERNARGDFLPERGRSQLQPQVLLADELDTLYTKVAAPFQEPDVIRSKAGKLVATLKIAKATNQIGSDPVYLRNYNGKLVGPTLRCKPGDTLYITLQNELDQEGYQPGAMDTLHGFDTSNLHTHGLHVSPSGNSDNVLLQVGPGSTQKYEIAIPANHPCGTFWYHAHLHGSTAANVGSGMSGALIIEGGIDLIPEIAAATERVLVLQQIPYVNKDNAIFCTANGDPGTNLGPVGVIEAEYVDCIFGPGTWDPLGRYTTINGVKLPVIKMRPGSIERWRLVDSAVREVIMPELVLHERSNPLAPRRLTLHEIAVDGLPLGRVARRSVLELWPGYRSDVLVQAPLEAGARYMLRDTRTPSKGNSLSEERRYLALVVVEGEPKPMKLPSDAQLAEFRLPSIAPSDVTGREVAAYGIIPKGNGVVFTVDRTPFGNDEARQITLGEVHEWTMISRNNVGPVSHPFHIHVNPFEIFSWVDQDGVEQLDRDPKTGAVLPVWRDTIILNEGWKVSCRTRYTDFDGVYVQHCHILDHEDQGMMELIEISEPATSSSVSMATAQADMRRPLLSYPAPRWELPDANGQPQKLSALLEGSTLLVFFEGFGCLRCNEQMQALIKQYATFRARGLQIIGISTDTVAGLKDALRTTACPFPLVADPEKTAFRAYGCYAGGPLHGVFLIDAASTVRWQVISKTPYRDFERIYREATLLRTSATVSLPAQEIAVDRR
jgi:FtsP/CotA-like multicopper oxidase with cupredoxin domain/peroxiredoxin